MIQGTDEWKAARLGVVTASRVVDILKGVSGSYKGKYYATRKNYMAEKVCEILTGESQNEKTSAPMQHGTETEPLARAAYEAKTGVWVEQDGFKLHDSIQGFGASPDGLIDTDGMCEIKCPNTITHIDTLLGSPIDRKYLVQMNAQMMVYNRKWNDFISFDDRLPDELSIFIKRFYLDETLAKEIELEVTLFNAELAAMVDRLKGLRGIV